MEKRKRRVYNKRRRKFKGREVEQIGGEVEGMKMAEDIRTVCDATNLELNDAIWAPWSPMPTVESYLRAVESETFMSDCDVGKMFLKLMLEPRLISHAGVDLTPSFLEKVLFRCVGNE